MRHLSKLIIVGPNTMTKNTNTFCVILIATNSNHSNGYLPSPASPSEAWPWLSWYQQQTQTCPCRRHSESL